jgi:4-diphosphocytidyl-2-C-methyl-D-erythritol kinase
VLGKRPDGYHELRMVMQQIDLCDEITLALTAEPGISVSCGRKGVPDGPGNIAWRAAEVLLARAGGTTGVAITINKKIPVAAGLGGGSSDCAAVLRGMNELLGLGLSLENLREIGVPLGADVPFFLFGRTALAEGIGERLSPLAGVPPVWLVLVNPGIAVSTAWVYQNLRLTAERLLPTLPSFAGGCADLCAFLANDLETVTIPRFPVIGEIKERLLAAGAHGALMSGSGPTVFGIFAAEAAARRAAAELARVDAAWFVQAMKTLT